MLTWPRTIPETSPAADSSSHPIPCVERVKSSPTRQLFPVCNSRFGRYRFPVAVARARAGAHRRCFPRILVAGERFRRVRASLFVPLRPSPSVATSATRSPGVASPLEPASMSSSPPADDAPSPADDAKRNNIAHPPRSRDAGSGVEGDSRDTDADDTDADDSEDERELAEERRKDAEARAAWERKKAKGLGAKPALACLILSILYLFASDPRGFLGILVGLIAGAPHPVGLVDAPDPVRAHAAAGRRVAVRSDAIPGGEASVFARHAGAVDAPETILLVHGSSSTSFAFRALIHEIAARGSRAVALDLPGFGLSAAGVSYDAVSSPTDDALAEALAAFVRAERLPPHHLVVAEDAAGIGVAYAAKHGKDTGKSGGGEFRVSVRSVTFLEPHPRQPAKPCADPRGALAAPARLADAYAASSAFPAAIARGCAPDMSPEDAASHAWLLRVDGALRNHARRRDAQLIRASNPRSVLSKSRDVPRRVHTQTAWAAERPTPAASAQAAAMMRFGGLRQTHGIVGTSAPWFAEPTGAPKETAEVIDAIVALAGGDAASRGRTKTRTDAPEPNDAEAGKMKPNARSESETAEADEDDAAAYARRRLAEHADAGPAATSAGTSSSAAAGAGCGGPDREEL